MPSPSDAAGGNGPHGNGSRGNSASGSNTLVTLAVAVASCLVAVLTGRRPPCA